MNNLRGKLVMITGASNGIGKATAIQYAEMEANLILMGRNEKALTELKDYITKRNSVEVYTIVADVRDYQSLREKIENLPANFKKIDILVNNAGLAIGMDKVYNNEAEDMANVVDTNIKGVLHMIQLIVPLMLEHGGGHVVNMGSVAGNAAYAGGAIYCGTKAAVKTISDGLRIDLVDKPVKVTTILPGMVETEFSLVRFKGDSERAAN
ncbi:MAG: SDR family NAD(P)-dependent oxidoreductase, partial [Fusobacteriaceae bacterium]